MAGRYDRQPVKKLKNGNVVYRTKIYPNIPLQDSDVYVATQQTDRLDTIANQFYGDPTLWWIIASANNIHDAPITLEPGTVLRIPEDYLNIINKFKR